MVEMKEEMMVVVMPAAIVLVKEMHQNKSNVATAYN
jgi:hypothetical protein